MPFRTWQGRIGGGRYRENSQLNPTFVTVTTTTSDSNECFAVVTGFPAARSRFRRAAPNNDKNRGVRKKAGIGSQSVVGSTVLQMSDLTIVLHFYLRARSQCRALLCSDDETWKASCAATNICWYKCVRVELMRFVSAPFVATNETKLYNKDWANRRKGFCFHHLEMGFNEVFNNGNKWNWFVSG